MQVYPIQNQFSDSAFRVFDNADNTKKVAFEVSGVTTDTTRTITIGDFDMTLIDWTNATSRLMTTLTTEQMRLRYDASNYVTFTVDADGDFKIDSSKVEYSLIVGDAKLEFNPTGEIQCDDFKNTDGAQAFSIALGSTPTVTFTGDITTAKDVTCDELTLTVPTQDFKFTNRTSSLALQSQTSSTSNTVEFYNKDGDNTDITQLILYSQGTPASVTDRERLLIQKNTTDASIWTEADGAGTQRPLILYTEGNTDQLKLDTTGDNLMSGALTVGNTAGVKLSAATGVLTLAGVGNTNNENLTLDFETTANEVAVGTGTGVTKIDFGSLDVDAADGTFRQITIDNNNNETGLIINNLGTATIGIDVSNSNLSGTDYLLYYSGGNSWRADGSFYNVANNSSDRSKAGYFGPYGTNNDFKLRLGNSSNSFLFEDASSTTVFSIQGNGNTLVKGNLVSDTYNFAADAEASDTYVITLAPAIDSYTTGLMITFTANTANTGACTVNVNALGAKTIKKMHDQDTATGDIEAGQVVVCVYDGTNMQMISQIAQ